MMMFALHVNALSYLYYKNAWEEQWPPG